MLFDSKLSELGEQQARNARKQAEDLDITNIIVSPFTRTLQTASLMFGANRKFVINADVREQLSNSCDVGSPPHELASAYPSLDFSHLAERWWHEGEKDHRGISVEPHEVLQKRVDEYAESLKRDGIHSTAIVTHGNYIHAMTGVRADNCQIVEFKPL